MGTILADLPDDWGREAKVLSGEVEEGKGTDYIGALGEDDPSGLLESTADKPVAEEKAKYLADAANMSSPEDYESQELPPQHSAQEDERSVVEDDDAANSAAPA